MIEVTIESAGRNSLKEKAILFDVTRETFPGIKEAQEYLIDRYGRLPNGNNKIYVDDEERNARITGFLHSFWTRDISHNSKPWFQTDWITVFEYTKKPVNVLRRQQDDERN